MAQQSRLRAATDAHEEMQSHTPESGRRRSHSASAIGRKPSARVSRPSLERLEDQLLRMVDAASHECQECGVDLPQGISQSTVCAEALTAAQPQSASSAGTLRSMSSASKGSSDVDNALQTQVEEQGGTSETQIDADESWPPTARILLTHETAHEAQCDKVCMKHMYFLIRILPTGRVTPPSELAVPAMAKIVRRQEEWFCMKTFEQIQELRRRLAEAKFWDDTNPIAHLPALPAKSVPARVWFGQEIGRRHNPQLVDELQTFLDILMSQPPSCDLAEKPALHQFFKADQVPLSHPLVQQVAAALGGDFPEFNDDSYLI